MMMQKGPSRCRIVDVGAFRPARGTLSSLVTAVLVFACSVPALAADLSANHLLLRPGTQGQVVVSGAIENEATFGFTIMLELVPRPGTVGKLEFTPVDRLHSTKRGFTSIHRRNGAAEEVRITRARAKNEDIAEIGDPWPEQGTFTVFDTDRTSSALLNGAIGDNGTFVAGSLTFRGAISAHPVRATANAAGVWDVLLSTSRGDSSWEGVPTTLHAGTITISAMACVTDVDCDDGDACTRDSCKDGRCGNIRDAALCTEQKPRKREYSRQGKTR